MGTIVTTGLERFFRLGFALSVVGHIGLLLGLVFVGASGLVPVPPEVVTVEIVPASEAPQAPQTQTDTTAIEGTPLESTSNGSEVWSDADKGSAAQGRPQPKSALASLPKGNAEVNAKRAGSRAAAQQQAARPAEPETQPRASEPLLAPPAPTIEPHPQQEEAVDQIKAGDMFAMPLALPGGKLGGGFDAPASKAAMLPHDDTAAFRARLSACSKLPPGIDEKVVIALRLSFKRDGRLAAPPELVGAAISADAALLLNSAVDALERCQPFSELPPDKYRKWKTLDLVVTPLALAGH